MGLDNHDTGIPHFSFLFTAGRTSVTQPTLLKPPHSSPAHAMPTNSSPIASRCTHKQKTRLKLSSVRLAAIQTLLPDLQVIPVSVRLQRVCVSVVSSSGGASCELSTRGLCICFSEYLPKTFAPSITVVKL